MSMLDSIAAARVSGPEPVAEGVARFEYNFPATDEVFTGHGRGLLRKGLGDSGYLPHV